MSVLRMNIRQYLYGKSKEGKALFWCIWYEPYQTGFQVFTEYGEVGTPNPQRTKPTVILKGKHIGKANETTAQEQTLLFIRRKYFNKIEKQGYVERLEDVETSIATDRILYPMLANKLSKKDLNKVKFPAYAQPKLDGVRCVARMTESGVVLKSRTGKPFVGLTTIEDELNTIFTNYPKMILDGELGCFPSSSGVKPALTFQEVCGYVKRTKKSKNDHEFYHIEFHVFDVIEDNPWNMRYQTLQEIRGELVNTPHIHIVESVLMSSAQEFLTYHQQNLLNGYEGTMYRASYGSYIQQYRSRDLLKYKDMQTQEFKIIGYLEGKGNDIETVIWVVDVGEGKQCKVRPKGTREMRRDMLQNADKYMGKMLTVQFQEYTDDGVPRFPVGLVVRDYE